MYQPQQRGIATPKKRRCAPRTAEYTRVVPRPAPDCARKTKGSCRAFTPAVWCSHPAAAHSSTTPRAANAGSRDYRRVSLCYVGSSSSNTILGDWFTEYDYLEGPITINGTYMARHCLRRGSVCISQCIRTPDKGIHACPVWKWEVVLGFLRFQDQLCDSDTCHISARSLLWTTYRLQQCCFISTFGISLQCSRNSTSSADNEIELSQHDVDANRAPNDA
jgi:hypothetical protein